MPSWSRVKEVLAVALEQPRETRSALLDGLCAGEPDVRAEVDALLAADAAAGAFIATPALPWLDLVDDAEEDPHIGRQLGPYLIERCLGRGGMGAVSSCAMSIPSGRAPPCRARRRASDQTGRPKSRRP